MRVANSTDHTWSLTAELREIPLPTVESNFSVAGLEELVSLRLAALYVDENRTCVPTGVMRYIIHASKNKKRSWLDNLWTALTLTCRLFTIAPGDDGYLIILDVALDDDVIVQQCNGSGCDNIHQILNFLWGVRGLHRAPVWLRPVGEVGHPDRCPQQMKLLYEFLSAANTHH